MSAHAGSGAGRAGVRERPTAPAAAVRWGGMRGPPRGRRRASDRIGDHPAGGQTSLMARAAIWGLFCDSTGPGSSSHTLRPGIKRRGLAWVMWGPTSPGFWCHRAFPEHLLRARVWPDFRLNPGLRAVRRLRRLPDYPLRTLRTAQADGRAAWRGSRRRGTHGGTPRARSWLRQSVSAESAGLLTARVAGGGGLRGGPSVRWRGWRGRTLLMGAEVVGLARTGHPPGAELSAATLPSSRTGRGARNIGVSEASLEGGKEARDASVAARLQVGWHVGRGRSGGGRGRGSRASRWGAGAEAAGVQACRGGGAARVIRRGGLRARRGVV